jgi:hypothetical protein
MRVALGAFKPVRAAPAVIDVTFDAGNAGPPVEDPMNPRKSSRTRTTATVAALLLVSTTWASVVGAQDSAPMDTILPPSPRGGIPPIEVQHFRPHDARGLNMFETPKQSGVPFTGFKIQWGASFTQQYQALEHENTADSLPASGPPPFDANELIDIGNGFNNANANLFLDAQLARGIRVEMTTYLSSRHHPETWVKDGYLLVDGSPWENAFLDAMMELVTLRIGHFEINYGDAHFRRTDNGNGLYNPLVGNLLMDAFTTEVGGELYVRKADWMAMVGATGGEIRGQVLRPKDRAATYLAKLGFDRQMTPELRTRLTGSLYTTDKSISNTLYTGSRSGSRYYYVLENVRATEAAQAWSGDVRPGFGSEVTAWVINPFVKFRGLELFGNIEQAEGRGATETSTRTWRHYAAEAVYRFLSEQLYVAGRWNMAEGELAGIPNDVTVDRVQVGGGWFITPNIEMKAEWMRQEYHDFPSTDIRNGGKFDGVVIEGVVAF